MAYEFKFPDIGEGLTEGELVRWLVKEGDDIKEGQPLAEVETDKALAEIPSPRTGTVLKLMAKEKEVIKVGQVIVVFGEKGEAIPSEPRKAPEAPRAPATQEAKAPETPKAPEIPKRPGEGPEAPRPSFGVVGELEEAPAEEKPIAKAPEERAKPREERPPTIGPHAMAAPAVRALARELGVDIDQVKGTGPQGRVVEKDIRQAAEAKTKPAEPEKKPGKVRKYDLYGYVDRVPLKGVRRSIAKAMVKSKYTAPHVTATDEADVTELWQLREKEKKAAEAKGIKLTILPFIIKAVISALVEHPYVNSTLEDENEEIVLKKYYNIGMATDTPEGLMVPVVKNAKEKSIFQLAEELFQLAERARKRTIDLADLKGGSFTITNYGSYGGIYGTPIINYPEVAILGLGKIRETPVVRDGKIEIRKILYLSLSFDHRVVDGAEAARFLNSLIKRLEDPNLLLLEG